MLTVTERPRRKRPSWESRCEIVAKVRSMGWRAEAARSQEVHRATVYRLLARDDEGGWAGLVDRRPVPRHQPRRLAAELAGRIVNARRASRYGGRALLRLPRARRGLVRGRARDPHRARPHRQWARVPLAPLAPSLPGARHRAPAHPALHAPHQRQGRGLHRHRPARVGLPLRRSDQRPPHPGPLRLGAVVQPTSSPELARQPAAGQPCRAGPWSDHRDRRPARRPGTAAGGRPPSRARGGHRRGGPYALAYCA